MTTGPALDDEPDAGASVEVRRRFLGLLGLFLAGPVIWISHFFVVYLPAEAICDAGVDAQLFGLHVASVLTLGATAVAVAAVALTTLLSYRRWRSTSVSEHDRQLALAGYLLGLLFAVAILFVGLPAAVLAC